MTPVSPSYTSGAPWRPLIRQTNYSDKWGQEPHKVDENFNHCVAARHHPLVAPLKGIRKGLFLSEANELLALLAADKEDIVKKGLVWLRKELAR